MRREALRPAIALLLVLVVAVALRVVGVSDIDRPYFDEKYYVTQAQERLDSLEPVDRPAHPPLGTWLIAAGITVAGDDPLGWRLASVVAGVGAVALTFALAQALWGRPWWSVAAAALVAVDGLAVTTSRVAILDGLQVPFAIGTVLCMVLWRRRHDHRWLVVAGASLGAMTAIKWNGALLVPVVVLMVLVSRRPARRRLRDVAVIGLTTAAVYVGSYATWFADYEDTQTFEDRCEAGECGTGPVARAQAWVWEQGDRVDFHRRLEAAHPDRSDPWSWPLMSEPVTIYLARCADPMPPGGACPYEPDESRQIVTVGNPALWWTAFLAAVPLGVIAVRRRQLDTAVPVVALAALYLPWFASPKPGFLYFLTPAVPFLALVLVRAIAVLPRRARRIGAVTVGLAVLGTAVWLAPLHYGWPLDPDELGDRAVFPEWRP